MRMALGARPRDVLRLVLVQGAGLALAGVASGVLCSLALVRVLRSLLYEVRAEDPVTFGIVSIVAIGVAVVACYIPARRATRADPMVALRCE
jgi:putative ABC transport system permease protein